MLRVKGIHFYRQIFKPFSIPLVNRFFLGDMPVQGVVAKLSKTPGGVYTPAPTLGQHNREVFGLTPEQEAALRAEGVI